MIGFQGGGIGSGVGRTIGGGLTALASTAFAKGVQKEQAKNHRLFAEINARRVARQVRYQQGLAAVGNAGAGNTQSGSFLFVASDNARQGAEKVQDQIFAGKQSVIQDKARTPTFTGTALNFVGSLAGSVAQQNASNFEAS